MNNIPVNVKAESIRSTLSTDELRVLLWAEYVSMSNLRELLEKEMVEAERRQTEAMRKLTELEVLGVAVRHGGERTTL